MLRKLKIFIAAFILGAHCLASPSAVYAAEGPIVNLGTIHDYIQTVHSISLPMSAANPKAAANMRYLLCSVDMANEMLNGCATTNYCRHDQAAVSAATAKNAVDNLIASSSCSKFFVTLTGVSAGNQFSFNISAFGKFTIDWGDGQISTITRPNTISSVGTYSHTYSTAGNYTVGIGGLATEYPPTYDATISFDCSSNTFRKTKMTRIAGSLGAIFPTLSSGANRQPDFHATFSSCSGLTSDPSDPNGYAIPEDLFLGVSGPPKVNMFSKTFYSCSDLVGKIPPGLFRGISDAPATAMFESTFMYCSNLTGSIPSGLFGNLSGAPADMMFTNTFAGCTGLTGSIPSGLFGNIHGSPALWMFAGTFAGCTGLTGSIPSGLFGNLSGAPANLMFTNTFANCTGLTGSIPSGLFGNLSGAPADKMFNSTFDGCSGLIGNIPLNLFGNISGAPADMMFNSTFRNCSSLTGSIPSGLFGNLSGAPLVGMFAATFENTGLTDISGGTNGLFTANFSTQPPGNSFIGMFHIQNYYTNTNRNSLSSRYCADPTPPSAGNPCTLLKPLYEISTNASTAFRFNLDLSDYANIPMNWK